MNTNKFKDQFLSLSSTIKNTKMTLATAIAVPLFILAGQGIVSANRTQTQEELSISTESQSPDSLFKRISQRQNIRTAVYNQFATVNYYNR